MAARLFSGTEFANLIVSQPDYKHCQSLAPVRLIAMRKQKFLNLAERIVDAFRWGKQNFISNLLYNHGLVFSWKSLPYVYSFLNKLITSKKVHIKEYTIN